MKLSFAFPLEKDVSVSDEIPNGYSQYQVNATQRVFCQGGFGTILSQEFRGADYSLVSNHYFLRRKLLVSPLTDKPLLLIHYMLDGKLWVQLNGMGKVRLQQGYYRLFYIPSLPLHKTIFPPGNYRAVHLNLTPHYFQSLSDPYTQFRDFLHRFRQNARRGLTERPVKIDHAVMSILNKIQNQPPGSMAQNDLFYQGKLRELLLQYVRTLPSSGPLPHSKSSRSDLKLYKHIIRFIENNLDQSLTVSLLTSEFEISRNRLYRLFRKYPSTSVHRYIKKERLKRALRLLKEEGLPLRTVAPMVGYSHAESLRFALKKEYGEEF